MTFIFYKKTVLFQTGSRKLDFDEFYQLSIEHQWLVKKLSKRYCSLFVPVCDRINEDPEEETFQDEIGKN